MVQLVPINIDKLGAASAMSGSKRYELADNMQVYLWYKGQYYATTLSQVNVEDYHLIGWYDSLGCISSRGSRQGGWRWPLPLRGQHPRHPGRAE